MTVDLALLAPAPGASLRIAIIGANGHVGAAIVKQALSLGHAVLALDRGPMGCPEAQSNPAYEYEYRQFDATDSRAYGRELRGCTACVHLAAVYNVHDDEGKPMDDLSQADIHNCNTAMSYNALNACAELGINRVVLASSVNAVGLIYSKRPKIDYLPVDELHPQRPEDAYSLSKSICEVQASSIARRHPSMRIASLRFHWVVPHRQVDPQTLHTEGGAWKDLWGWVSIGATADACLRGLTVPLDTFPGGHEVFIIAAKTTCRHGDSMELLRTMYMPEKEGMDIRADFSATNRSFWDTSKAERMLGWSEKGWAWTG